MLQSVRRALKVADKDGEAQRLISYIIIETIKF